MQSCGFLIGNSTYVDVGSCGTTASDDARLRITSLTQAMDLSSVTRNYKERGTHNEDEGFGIQYEAFDIRIAETAMRLEGSFLLAWGFCSSQRVGVAAWTYREFVDGDLVAGDLTAGNSDVQEAWSVGVFGAGEGEVLQEWC
jgi:hypothetical protein